MCFKKIDAEERKYNTIKISFFFFVDKILSFSNKNKFKILDIVWMRGLCQKILNESTQSRCD